MAKKPGRRIRKKSACPSIKEVLERVLVGLRQPHFWVIIVAALAVVWWHSIVLAIAMPVGFALEHGTHPALLGARDPARAAWWYSLAVDRGSPFAMTRFAWILESYYANATNAGPIPEWAVQHATTFAGRSLVKPYGGDLIGDAWAARYYTLANAPGGDSALGASAFVAGEFYRQAMSLHVRYGPSGEPAYNAGVLLESGRGVEGGPQPKLATQFFAAASLEHESALPHAMLTFGLRYTSNCLGMRTGMGRNYKVACGWFRRAAQEGQPDAMINAAWMEERGFMWGGEGIEGVVVPPVAADTINGEASDDGIFGRFRGTDKERALQWYQMAANTIDGLDGLDGATAEQTAHRVQNAPFVRPRPAWVPAAYALSHVARLTLDLGGGAENEVAWAANYRGHVTAALGMYRRAAALGDGEALYRMGLLAEMGRIDDGGIHPAVWYERAAIAGSPGGMYAWAHALRTGEGVEPGRFDAAGHEREAELWYTRAADKRQHEAVVHISLRRRLARDAERAKTMLPTKVALRAAALRVVSSEEEQDLEGEDEVIVVGGDGYLGCSLPDPPPPTWAMAEAEHSNSRTWEAPRVIPAPWTAEEWENPPARLPVILSEGGVIYGGVGSDILVDGGGELLMQQVSSQTNWSTTTRLVADAALLLRKHRDCVRRRTARRSVDYVDGDEEDDEVEDD